MKRPLQVALWALLVLAGNALQVVAATHWHSNALVVSTQSQPASPDGIDHDGCLLCQVAAHMGTAAAPPAQWVSINLLQSQSAAMQEVAAAVPRLRPAHSWQGRAPPRV